MLRNLGKIIHSQYKNDFKKFLVEQVKQKNNG